MKGQRKKAFWAKQRVLNAETRAAEKKANTARKPRKRREFVELKPREGKFVITEAMQRTANAPSANPDYQCRDITRAEVKSTMSEQEYVQREQAARVEIERKKKQVAPLYNKGGYQYVGDAPPEIIETLGRKV